ncbi:hypothetical protein HDV00_010896 [Rhizophlyctis rosea]|nr:hypothetical protein HDV00_010896 [Rhizophlyctis rosea]
MDDLRQWTIGGKKYSVQDRIDVYLDESTAKVVESTFPYLFDKKKATGGGDVPSLEFHVFGNGPGGYEPVMIEELEVIPFQVEHGSAGENKFMSLGYRFGDFTYISDASGLPEKAQECIKGTTTLVLDALHYDTHTSHFSISESITAASTLLPPGGRLYFTGMSHRVDHDTLNQELAESAILKEKGIVAEVAYDGMKLSVDGPTRTSNPAPTSTSKPKTVLLCRAKSDVEDDGIAYTEDPYEKLFKQNGFDRSLFLPVLEHVPCNQDELSSTLRHPDQFAGLVITSKRALESISNVLAKDVSTKKNGTTPLPEVWKQWLAKPVYVVGPETARVAEEMGLTDVRGKESGRAEVLVTEIINAKADFGGKPLLFLAGSKHRGTLPDGLQQAGVDFRTIVVYETEGSKRVDEEVERLLEGQKGGVDWVVFFSPLGVRTALPVLRSKSCWGEGLKVAAIGPTTAKEVEDSGVVVTITAAKPNVDSLVMAIVDAGEAL